MRKGMKIYGSFNADSYQVSIDWLTVTLKIDNHGGRQAMLLTKDHGTGHAIGLLRTLSINWTLNKTR